MIELKENEIILHCTFYILHFLGFDLRNLLESLATLVLLFGRTRVRRLRKSAETNDFFTDVHRVPTTTSILTKPFFGGGTLGHKVDRV